MGQALADMTREPVKTKPFAVFVAEGVKIAEAISNPSLNAYEVGLELASLSTFAKTVESGIDARR